MLLLLRSRQAETILKTAIASLCASIFLWGLTAKLSLYQPQSPAQHKMVAKLIPDAQMNGKGVITRAVLLDCEQNPPPEGEHPTKAQWLDVCRIRHSAEPMNAAITYFSHALRFRPPPTIA
jgi:hypothetical protein